MSQRTCGLVLTSPCTALSSPPRANASNSTPIVAETLIWSSVQTYDSSGFRPLSGGTHGCDYSRGFDQEAFCQAERSSCPWTNTTSVDRHYCDGHLRGDWQLR